MTDTPKEPNVQSEREALQELVALKDLKDRIEAAEHGRADLLEVNRWRGDYLSRKWAAWARAREVLNADPELSTASITEAFTHAAPVGQLPQSEREAFLNWTKSITTEQRYDFDSEGRGYKKDAVVMMWLAWLARALLESRTPIPAQAGERDLFEQVGREMVQITTTVRGPDEWLAIPGLWLQCMKERDEALAALAVTQAPLKTKDVLAAIYAVDREAARRGEMYPQTSDEQREDRRAVTRVMGMIGWYEKNTGCARIEGWPTLEPRTPIPAQAGEREALPLLPAGCVMRDHHGEAEFFTAADMREYARAALASRAAAQAQAGEREALPLLPKPVCAVLYPISASEPARTCDGYTADQMREYARAAVASQQTEQSK